MSVCKGDFDYFLKRAQFLHRASNVSNSFHRSFNHSSSARRLRITKHYSTHNEHYHTTHSTERKSYICFHKTHLFSFYFYINIFSKIKPNIQFLLFTFKIKFSSARDFNRQALLSDIPRIFPHVLSD